MFDIAIFDLDGTLTDSKIGITKSMQYALRHFGIDVPDTNELIPFIGTVLRTSFMEVYGFSPEKAEEAIAKYREYFSVTGIYENEVYPGIRDLLKRLKDVGVTLAIATSKAVVYAKQIAEYFDVARYFDVIAGSELDGTRSKKSEVVAYALELLGAGDRRAVMIGDRKHDIIGAAETGIPGIGVLWGYGTLEELQEAGAHAVASAPIDLLALIL